MDVATIVGLVLAWGALLACLILEGGSIGELFNLPALVLVVFGTVGATLIGTSMKTILGIGAVLRQVVVEPVQKPLDVVDSLVECARIARREGILALEKASKKIDNRFQRKGLELVVDGIPSVMVREILETEIATMQDRHKVGETVFTTLGGLSPTLGIIGTVMGLISMLAKLNEPGRMGHAIAAAFIATLYGVAFANLLYLPIASKLKVRTADEVVIYEMIIEGLLSIQAGENPRMVEARMLAFLPPALRAEREAAQPQEERKAARMRRAA